jgi:hypothetical protein
MDKDELQYWDVINWIEKHYNFKSEHWLKLAKTCEEKARIEEGDENV